MVTKEKYGVMLFRTSLGRSGCSSLMSNDSAPVAVSISLGGCTGIHILHGKLYF